MNQNLVTPFHTFAPPPIIIFIVIDRLPCHVLVSPATPSQTDQGGGKRGKGREERKGALSVVLSVCLSRLMFA